MEQGLDDLLSGFGVNPNQGPDTSTTSEGRRSGGSAFDLPPRFAELLRSDSELRGMFEGAPGANPDRTPSGKDMVLGHRCRKLGFGPEEVREILRAARYRVDGGRTEDYLDRTVGKIFKPRVSGSRPSSASSAGGFGQLPARLLDGTWAALTPKAAKLYGVLVIRCMRPTAIVRDSHSTLAEWAGIGKSSVGRAVKELVDKGLLRRRQRWHGAIYWVISPPPFAAENGVCGDRRGSGDARGDINREVNPDGG